MTSLTSDAVRRMSVLQKRINEARKVANPTTFTVWRRNEDGFIGYMSHTHPLINGAFPGFEILGSFDNKLETLEFIVSTLLCTSGVGAAL